METSIHDGIIYAIPKDNTVTKAVKLAGGKFKLGPMLDVSPATVHRWSSVNAIPIPYACIVAKLSGTRPIDLIGNDMRLCLKQIAEYK